MDTFFREQIIPRDLGSCSYDHNMEFPDYVTISWQTMYHEKTSLGFDLWSIFVYKKQNNNRHKEEQERSS